MADPLPTLTDARRLHPVAMSVALGLALVLGVVQLGIWIPNLAIRPAKVVLDHDTWYLGRIVLGLAAVLAGISAFPGGRYYLVVGIWRQYFVNFPSVVSPLPVVFAALSFLLFSQVGQMHEVYLVIIENDARFQFLIGMVLLIALSTAVFAASIGLTLPHADAASGGTAIPLMPALRGTRYAVALLCGLSPLLGLLAGFVHTQNLIASTVQSAWAATRQVTDSGPLTLPAGDHLGFSAPLDFSKLQSLAFLIDLLWVGGAIAAVTALGLWQCYVWLGRPKSVWANVGSILLCTLGGVALVIAVVNLPGLWAPGSDIHLTDLTKLSNYYMGTALASIPLMLYALWRCRHSQEAMLLIWLACGAIAVVALVTPALVPGETLVDATRAIGPLAMAAGQLITIFTLFYFLTFLSRRTGVPLILSLVVLIVVRAFMTSAEAPQTRPVAVAPSDADSNKKQDKEPEKRTIPQDEDLKRLKAWLAARADRRGLYKDKRFPIYLIAAQGGGIYAASAAAVFLSRLEDYCPGFSQHVFAISGVSGGSVGAVGYSALVRDRKEPPRDDKEPPRATPCTAGAGYGKVAPPGEVAKDAAWIATQDHLSPVLALVTPEYAEKAFWLSARKLHFLFAEKPWHTRANALERSLACAFHARPSRREPPQPAVAGDLRKTCSRSTLDPKLLSFEAHFKPEKPWPALLLNTTFVETGQRVVFSPFELGHLGDAHLISFAELGKHLVSQTGEDGKSVSLGKDPASQKGKDKKFADVELAEAAVISARFPGLMPAYEVPLEGGKGHWNFVDGGYSDNSGVATAYAVMQQLRALLEKLGHGDSTTVRLVVLTSEVGEVNLPSLKGTSLVDTRAPLEALLNVRSTLAAREIARATAGKDAEWKPNNRDKWKVGVIGLDQKNFSLQLGWTLSRTTNLIISLFVTRPEYCSLPHPLDPSLRNSFAGAAAGGAGSPAAGAQTSAGGTGSSTGGDSTRAAASDPEPEAIARAERIAANACLIRDIIRSLS